MAKILLVEDDKSLREIYGVRLRAEGYEIVSAGDGEQALAIAIKEKPDLIISDVMMPKISGFDMLDILRSTPETRDMKVIMMTALSSEDQRSRGESLGANRYLVKSQVGIEDVVRAVHEVLADMPIAETPVTNIFSTPSVVAAPSVQPNIAPVATSVQTPPTPSYSAPVVAPVAPIPAVQQPVNPMSQPAPIQPQPQPQPVTLTQSGSVDQIVTVEPAPTPTQPVMPETTPSQPTQPIMAQPAPISQPQPATSNEQTTQNQTNSMSNVASLIEQELNSIGITSTPVAPVPNTQEALANNPVQTSQPVDLPQQPQVQQMPQTAAPLQQAPINTANTNPEL